MQLLLKCDTSVGTFFIGRSPDGRFHPIFDEESLGSYAHDWQATEDLANGVTFSVLHPETGDLLDTSTLGIPDSPGDWDQCR